MADSSGNSGTDFDLASLSLSSLTHLCRQSTDRYFSKAQYDDSYCIELFRRAVVCKDQYAWENVVEQYNNLIMAWVQRHPSFHAVDEEKAYFVNRAFLNFWRAFERDPHKFSKFNNLKSLLQYLKLCTNTAVQEYAERQMRPYHINIYEKPIDLIRDEDDAIGNFEDDLVAEKIWLLVQSLLKNEKETIVAEMSFIYDMKPKELFRKYKDVFKSVGEVRRVKGNLLARLRRDKDLLRILEGID